jgi:hypothetical protein
VEQRQHIERGTQLRTTDGLYEVHLCTTTPLPCCLLLGPLHRPEPRGGPPVPAERGAFAQRIRRHLRRRGAAQRLPSLGGIINLRRRESLPQLWQEDFFRLIRYFVVEERRRYPS